MTMYSYCTSITRNFYSFFSSQFWVRKCFNQSGLEPQMLTLWLGEGPGLYEAILQQFTNISEFFQFFHSSQGEACKDKIVPMQNFEHANTAGSPTPRSVSHFWIFGKFNCRLRVVLACAESDHCLESQISRISSRKRIFRQKHFSLFYQGPRWLRFMK